jgi:hypothetical protein
VLCRYRLARKNKGKWKKPFFKKFRNCQAPRAYKLLITSLLVDSECEGTLLLQKNCGSCSVVFPKKIRQRGTKLTVCAKIMPKVMQGIDLILGMDHVKQFGVKLDCQRDNRSAHTRSWES